MLGMPSQINSELDEWCEVLGCKECFKEFDDKEQVLELGSHRWRKKTFVIFFLFCFLVHGPTL